MLSVIARHFRGRRSVHCADPDYGEVMATKKKATPTPDAEKAKPRKSRDYSQRAHDTVREAEKRHEERHKDD